MLAVEEMQSQQRAEQGIREIIVGYIGYPEWMPDDDEIDTNQMKAAFADAGGVYETSLSDLPDDIREIVEAENHRLQTGEVLTVEQYKRKKG